MSFPNTVSGEVESFLAGRGLSFDALNDDPELIAELEDMLIPALKSAMEGSTCSGAYFCLDATANTSLPTSETSRAGVYLRYSGLRSAHPSGTVSLFPGNGGCRQKKRLAASQPLEPGAEHVPDPRLPAGHGVGRRQALRRLPLDRTGTAAGYLGERDACCAYPCVMERVTVQGRLRHGAERPVFRPVPQHGLRLLRQLS